MSTNWDRAKEAFRKAKERFIEEGGGTFFDLLRHHPQVLFSSVAKRQKWWNESYYSVERKSGKPVLYLNPKRGSAVKMPPEESFWTPGENLELLASGVSNEYELPVSCRKTFTDALVVFMSAPSGKKLVFMRNGKTKVV